MIEIKKSIKRKTSGTLPYNYGSDSGKPLVVTLDQGDLVTLRPSGTRRPETVSLFDIYSFAIRCRVNRDRLEKARMRKEKIRIKREEQEIKRRFKI